MPVSLFFPIVTNPPQNDADLANTAAPARGSPAHSEHRRASSTANAHTPRDPGSRDPKGRCRARRRDAVDHDARRSSASLAPRRSLALPLRRSCRGDRSPQSPRLPLLLARRLGSLHPSWIAPGPPVLRRQRPEAARGRQRSAAGAQRGVARRGRAALDGGHLALRAVPEERRLSGRLAGPLLRLGPGALGPGDRLAGLRKPGQRARPGRTRRRSPEFHRA